MRDKNFLTKIVVPTQNMLVLDWAYNYYKQFAKWTDEKICFVTRQKKNVPTCRGEILQSIQDKILPKDQFGVFKE